jgi:hypothetical protein
MGKTEKTAIQLTARPANPPLVRRLGQIRKPWPSPLPVKHRRYPEWDTDMTVCIAAASILNEDPLLVLCADMMGSTDFSSAETTWKYRPVGKGFHALLSGPTSNAREMVSACHQELLKNPPVTMAEAIKALRTAVGEYKNILAEAHIQSRLGVSYEEFRKNDGSQWPEDLYRDLLLEIKNSYSNVELIVAGFLNSKPVIYKISGDSVWSCDDFAVIGAGTPVAEASLFHREQSFFRGKNHSLYFVYEAKKLSERAPGVGKKTRLYVVRPDNSFEETLPEGFQILESHFSKFAPRPIETPVFPETAFKRYAPPSSP